MMPPKLNPETPKQQHARFKREAQKLIDAGELNPIEAEAGMDRAVRNAATRKPS
jgi:hypothetical protein